MGNIVLLDELTINKIAAGEVIERPAAVIKEMVENSIDAGATNITVEIKNGGISYIKVTDNGKGIAQDDLEIAFERHATSKIRSADDLSTVTSMGFRGEALASIAAIANVEMISKTKEQEIGYRVVVEAGNILEKEEAGCRTGTSITVRNLFFNTPVRYKFLKKDYTESGYIEDAITRIALVNPNIAIKLINTGKTVIQTNGNGDLKSVIYSIYGKDIANGIMEVEYKYEDIFVTGVIGKPEIARSNRSNQLFFVNKRYIKDKTLTAATEQAYKGLIPIGKFGFVVLNLEMNPTKVDVNVHPAKLEVRFEEENKVFQAIYHTIKDTLLKGELVANTEKNSEDISVNSIDRSAVSFEERLKKIRETKKENQGGLFSFRKQNEKQIEEYTEEESKIKTNNIVEDVLKQKDEEKTKIQSQTQDLKNPIDTSDVLQQLKQMKKNIEKELQEKNIVPNTLKETDVEYKTDVEKEENIIKQASKQTSETEKIIEEKEEQPIEDATTVIEGIQDEEVQKEFEEIKQKMQDLKDNPKVVSEDFNEMYSKMFGTLPIQEETEEKKKEDNKANAVDIVKDNITVFENIEEFKKPVYKFVGIVFNTYIILEIEKEMYILDQHAAHERIMYEKVKKNYYSEATKDSQMLLLPDVITLTHKEMDIAKENMDMFKKAGFTLEEFGENTIKLTGVPTVCIDLDTKELFLETLDEINTVARTAKQEKEEKFIATVACKAAVKANMALTTQEVESLMDKLLELPNPFTCPHGRPTVIKMTKYDIERKFARK
ncbi:MAG: DNA mismatch repair endonuclease MutL [Clostridia bacterium]|nr:DNA mismatch repair endonuclease MutL [Clostridia bacterium]